MKLSSKIRPNACMHQGVKYVQRNLQPLMEDPENEFFAILFSITLTGNEEGDSNELQTTMRKLLHQARYETAKAYNEFSAARLLQLSKVIMCLSQLRHYILNNYCLLDPRISGEVLLAS